MKRSLALRVVLAAFAALAAFAVSSAPTIASAQFQSCNFCDVLAFNPDPFDVNACDTGSIIINGQGFRATANNGCSGTPVDEVRSTRPDRVLILGFTVLSDTQIRMDYMVPCNASAGIVGIDVTIDDIPGDGIIPYACGIARMFVHARTLAVTWDAASARSVAGGVDVTWSTLSEENTLGFALWTRSRTDRNSGTGSSQIEESACKLVSVTQGETK